MILEYGTPAAQNILIQPVGEHDLPGLEEEAKGISEKTDIPFKLIAVKVDLWNRDLSPWSAPPVFGQEPFGSGAPATLERILSLCSNSEKTYFLGGYSLAGLFSLWAAYQTNVFSGVASASGSLWFPGFEEYMASHTVKCKTVYLSLGSTEEKTKNPVMASVGERTRRACALLKAQNVCCSLEWNPGNHFKDPAQRTAKAFACALNNTR
ncbi:MAG: esterase [Clostridia bacterium]|nr:esterase [Clostridia bacterium]